MDNLNNILPDDISLIIYKMHTELKMRDVLNEIILLSNRSYIFNPELELYWYMRWERELNHVYNFYFH
jgi:hypothetical protein